MNNNIPKVNLFNHYNLVVFTVFLIIIVFATTIAVYRYQYELDIHRNTQWVELSEQGNIINQSLLSSERTLKGLREFSEYYLQNPNDLMTLKPSLTQAQDRFFLETTPRNIFSDGKRLQSNITGLGNVASFDSNKWQELRMAQALTPAFIAGSANNEDATWFYYLSNNDFVSIYPWISHNAWQFSPQMTSNVYFKEILAKNQDNEAYIWSSPFKDTAGKGFIASIGTGVKLNNKLTGALVIDVDLASLKDKLPAIEQASHGYVLMNQLGEVLLYKDNTGQTMPGQLEWHTVVPASLARLSSEDVLAMSDSQLFEGWFLQSYHLESNDWRLIKYQPYSDFTSPLLNQFASIFGLFFIGLVTFLALVFLITRRSFVKPATQFISHIEYCAKGDPGKIRPNKDWLPWFQIVENIFSENRSLLQQLKEQNAKLDSRVAEKTQALIKSSEQHHRDYVLLRSVMNAIPEFILFNDNEGKLIGCNKSFEQYIEQSESSLLGRKIVKQLPDPLAQAFEEFAALPYDKSQQGYSQTVKILDSTFDVYSTRFYNDGGLSLGSISIIRDVSAQYAAQSALQSAKEQAEFANKAKSQFLANMSHEIRTPINAIKGMMALMEKTPLSAFQQQYLSNAQGASGALLHLIDELLDLSRIEAGKLDLDIQPAKIDVIVDKVLQLNAINAHKKGLELNVTIDSDVPYAFETDEMRLVQVLANLVNNAIKFTERGEVAISIHAALHNSQHSTLTFKVKDTGIGIAADKREHLFDAFSQADDSMTREYGGSGLGLSISRQIVTSLGGNIAIESELNVGSEFSFVLPIIVSKHVEPEQSPLTLIAFACKFEPALVQSVSQLGWHYVAIDDPQALSHQVINEHTIMLIDGDYLAEHPEMLLTQIDTLTPQLKLLGVCQPLMTIMASERLEQMNALNTPYLLFEKPVYRYTLLKIKEYLNSDLPEQHAKQKRLNDSSEVEPAQPTTNGCLQGVQILLVEDNLVNQMVAQELLSAMGAEVEIAENGLVALTKLTAHTFDVVLMDIQMPVMDGLTATREIRRLPEYAQLPIIAMTAHARAEDKEASMAAGMNLHIAKPVSPNTLSESILNILARTTVVEND